VANEWALRARSRHPHESKWLNELAIDDPHSADAIREQTRSQVARALLTLPPRAREILRLRYRDGLSNAQIAARLKVHPQTVKRDLLQAYGRLRLDLRLNEVVGLARSKEIS
jgi:RNA polymerase sigma factor (sigma-70 family)